MHGLDYIHGDLKSVRILFGLIASAPETFYSLTFSLTGITLSASRTLGRLSSLHQSLT